MTQRRAERRDGFSPLQASPPARIKWDNMLFSKRLFVAGVRACKDKWDNMLFSKRLFVAGGDACNGGVGCFLNAYLLQARTPATAGLVVFVNAYLLQAGLVLLYPRRG
jgi:hypothetical protein